MQNKSNYQTFKEVFDFVRPKPETSVSAPDDSLHRLAADVGDTQMSGVASDNVEMLGEATGGERGQMNHWILSLTTRLPLHRKMTNPNRSPLRQ